MNLNLIRKQWNSYEKLFPSKAVEEILSDPEVFLDEPITHLLPNIEFAADGPVVASVLFVSASYIGESRIVKDGSNFDILIKKSIGNYRIQTGKKEVVRNAAAIEHAKAQNAPVPQADVVEYKTAVLELTHNLQQFTTEVSYFGDSREDWLRQVKLMFPVKLLKEC